MKRELRAHPLMLFTVMKPFLFVLVLPVLKGLIQYAATRRVSGILLWESVAVGFLFAAALLRFRSFRLWSDGKTVTVQSGFFLRKRVRLDPERLSCVTASQNPVETLLRAVRFRINTEAGHRGAADFTFHLCRPDALLLNDLLYSENPRYTVRYSVPRQILTAAATSSAVTGLTVGVPLINRVGKLIGVGVAALLLNGISTATSAIPSYFPPVVNTVSAVLLIAYGLSFLLSLLRTLGFRLRIGDDTLEIRSGILTRRRILFRRSAVNALCIEQNPLLRLLGKYSVRASVAGSTVDRGEKAVLAPCGRRAGLRLEFSSVFPQLHARGKTVKPRRSHRQFWRFMFFSRIFAESVLAAGALSFLLFPAFERLTLFLMIIAFSLIWYYASLCVFLSRFGHLRIGENVFVRSVSGFRTREFYCEKCRLGLVRIWQNPPDRKEHTCRVVLTVRSENADRISIPLLDRDEVASLMSDAFGVDPFRSDF